MSFLFLFHKEEGKMNVSLSIVLVKEEGEM